MVAYRAAVRLAALVAWADGCTHSCLIAQRRALLLWPGGRSVTGEVSSQASPRHCLLAAGCARRRSLAFCGLVVGGRVSGRCDKQRLSDLLLNASDSPTANARQRACTSPRWSPQAFLPSAPSPVYTHRQLVSAPHYRPRCLDQAVVWPQQHQNLLLCDPSQALLLAGHCPPRPISLSQAGGVIVTHSQPGACRGGGGGGGH
jgi:hypothetical protein